MKNYHVIKVKYMGPTNFKGSRIKLTSDRFEHSVVIPYNYSFNNALDIAEAWLTEKGFDLVGHSCLKGFDLVITDTFKPLR